jgi:hypothetical protein
MPVSLSPFPALTASSTARPALVPGAPRFGATPNADHFVSNRSTRATAMHPRFAGEAAEQVARANLLAVQNVLPQEDIDAMVDYFRTRDKSKYSHMDSNKIRVEASWLEGVVETKDGQVVQAKWNSNRGTELNEAQRGIMNRLMDAFIQNLNLHVDKIPDDLHQVVATPMEYTFKPGYKADKTLDWHRDAFIKYLGMFGIFKDPRIHGAQLELRNLDKKDEVQTFETIPNQLLMFHNIKAEHRVSGIEVDDTDADRPVYRNIITVGIKPKDTSFDYVGAIAGAVKTAFARITRIWQPKATAPYS